MHRNTTHRPCRTVGISRHSALGSSSVDQPHARTVADMTAECAALDHGYATWFSHQVEEVIAREEEDDLAGGVEILQRNSSWLPRYAIFGRRR
jgi:hypothetical protein